MNQNIKLRANHIYRLADFFAAIMAWFLFFSYRKWTEYPDETFTWSLVWQDSKLYLGLIVIPVYWILVYYLFDEFGSVFRLSRISTFGRTLILSFFGCIIILLTIIQDDIFLAYRTYAFAFVVLFSIHFAVTILLRIAVISWFKRRMNRGLVKFKTIIVGSGQKADEIYREIRQLVPYQGYDILGFFKLGNRSTTESMDGIVYWKGDQSIQDIVQNHNIEEVIIATEEDEKEEVKGILDELEELEEEVTIKITHDLHDMRLGRLRMTHVYGLPLLQLDQRLMSRWEIFAKRLIDVGVSIVMPVLLSPLILYIAIRVKMSSPGSILFKQERVGKNQKAFAIYKFRSMFEGAEVEGPKLSYDGDVRCTAWGATMRKWRLDEIPQFYNVLKGDMSLVGPRPERAHFIRQIMEQIPEYKYLFKVRPGVTSLGQVKYGYASNLKEMLKRLKYDLIYIENMGLGLDMKILFYTLIVLVQGKGK